MIILGIVISVLKRLRSNHDQQTIIGHLNISSIRNKYDIMKPMLVDDIDIFMVSETKLDDSFPVSQFNVECFRMPFRLDGNKNGESIIFYICSYIIASKLTSFTFPNDIEAFFIEINLKSNKWLISCSYNPSRTFASNHPDRIAKGVNTYSKKYEKFLLMGILTLGLQKIIWQLFAINIIDSNNYRPNYYRSNYYKSFKLL